MIDIDAEAFCEHGVSHRKQCRKCNERLLKGSLPKILPDSPVAPGIDAIVAEVERLEADKAGDIWVYRDGYYRTAVPLLAAECKRLRHTVETKVPALEAAMVLQGEEIARLRKQCDLALGELVCVFREPNPCGECGPCQALTRIAALEARHGEKA